MGAVAVSLALRAVTIARPFGLALRSPANWMQFTKFCLVGGSGYVVNLAVYSCCVRLLGVHYLAAAVCSFLVAVSSNYALNRVWTFCGGRRHVATQGARYLLVSVAALAANLVALSALVAGGATELVAQAAAIVLVTPLSFVGNKLWTFRA